MLILTLDSVKLVGIDQITPEWISASKDLKLSPHFSLWEMCNNWRGGALERFNFFYGSVFYLDNLIKLCNELLEPIRAHFGPIHVNSAMRWARKKPFMIYMWEGLDYEIRSPYVQKDYSLKSQHIWGEAADIVSTGSGGRAHDPRELFTWVRTYSPQLNCPNPFGQLIYEVSDRTAWLHISIPGMRKKDGSLIYGEVMDAKVDTMGRARYAMVEHLCGGRGKDVWGKEETSFQIG